MHIRKTSLAAALILCATAAAVAQTRWVEIRDDAIVEPFARTADAVDDLDVFDSSGHEIGEVEEVLGRDAMLATALVVDFDERFAAQPDDDLIVPVELFRYADGKLVYLGTAEELKGRETWDD